ncbi:MAG: signal transduction histidine kinase regulating C4-dicarboxylate transport system [Clostridiales bacterium]|jgi:signal transduction histidine kinase|nr:signal transduction histidine kinase regulating C4-dicarboxylate transport system [Clostridiales bacterium]
MLVTIILFIFTILVLSVMLYAAYINDRDTIIEQQEEQLLTIAKSISRSMEVFINEKASSLKVIARNHEVAEGMAAIDIKSVQQDVEAYYQAQKDDVQRVMGVDKTGKVIIQYPMTSGYIDEKAAELIKEDIQRVFQDGKPLISSAKLEQKGQFNINIFEPVFLGEEFAGVLVSSVNLNTMYAHLVKPVKVGQKGYVMVKDGEGIILMHPANEQVGMDVIETRRQVFPNFDLKELEQLINMQMVQEEGKMAYYSYWWTDEHMERTKKLNAFSRAHFEEYFWIVAVVMSFDEIEEPLAANRIKIIEIYILILLILSAAIIGILKMQKNKEALEIETKYLREINVAIEELRKKDLQLQHSQKLQVLGTLTGGIAHEFNNLLTPIRGYAEILMNKAVPKSDIHDYINEIYEASGKAKDIIEQILVFSRSDNGKSRYEHISVVQVLEDTMNLIKTTITPNVRVIFEKQDDLGIILANKVQVQQVIFNLCTNAFHAMKYSGGIMKVSVDTVSSEEVKNHDNNVLDNGNYVRISVSDTGYGMNKETLSRIFDPFYTTKPAGEGTGLGLFIVHGIVDNHKGFINVNSEIGKGSTFTLYFPRTDIQLIHEKEPEQDIPKEYMNVLLVDDEEKVLKVMKKGLEQFGYKVHAESNSIEALKTFDHDPSKFRVVVTDQTMPYIKGLELAERIKVLNPSIKVILVTGFADEMVIEYMERDLIDDFILKPVTGSDLARMIKKVLQS